MLGASLEKIKEDLTNARKILYHVWYTTLSIKIEMEA